MIKFFNNIEARNVVINKIENATKLLNMASGTKGRLPISFGVPNPGGVPQVAISAGRDNVWKFYNETVGGGIVVHEQLGNDELRQWAAAQAVKFIAVKA